MDGIICELFWGDRNFLFTLDTTSLGYAITQHRLRSDRSERGAIARGFMQMGELRRFDFPHAWAFECGATALMPQLCCRIRNSIIKLTVLRALHLRG
jgi:hypothetical protein